MSNLLKVFLICLSLVTSSFSLAWSLEEKKDEMTDSFTRTATVKSAEGASFTLLRRSNGAVWGYLKLNASNQFMVGEELLMRIDKLPPVEFNDKLQKLLLRLGDAAPSWEWNPSLIGFSIWHGTPEDGKCGQISDLLRGKSLRIRYHPNQSTSRDLVFDISKTKETIRKALDVSLADCPN
jgi:hypothetical protein